MVILRDDDISIATDLNRFKEIHELYNKYDLIHTIAVITKDICNANALVDYILSQKNIDIQLHCYTHDRRFTELDMGDLIFQYNNGMSDIKTVFDKIPTIHYPCWNAANELVIQTAKSFGLIVSNKKVSLSNFIKHPQDNVVINHHYWSSECDQLEDAMKIIKGNGWNK